MENVSASGYGLEAITIRMESAHNGHESLLLKDEGHCYYNGGHCYYNGGHCYLTPGLCSGSGGFQKRFFLDVFKSVNSNYGLKNTIEA